MAASPSHNLPLAWMVSLNEPLIDTTRRIMLEDAMDRMVNTHTVWSTWWFAGVLADHAMTLPPADPWRRLTATATGANAERITRGLKPAPMFATGASSPRGVFGRPADAGDLVASLSIDAIETDLQVAALSPGLGSISAAVLAFAADDYRRLAGVIEMLGEGGGHGQMFVHLAAALRWLSWRRRAYTGPEDTLSMTSAMNWCSFADELAETGTLDESSAEEMLRLRRMTQLDDDDYALMSGASEFPGAGSPA